MRVEPTQRNAIYRTCLQTAIRLIKLKRMPDNMVELNKMVKSLESVMEQHRIREREDGNYSVTKNMIMEAHDMVEEVANWSLDLEPCPKIVKKKMKRLVGHW